MSSDWLNAFDNQCRTEGLEVPEKEEDNQSSSNMEQTEENKGSSNSGIGRGGMFGNSKTAPPPQTSFGATSGIRMGGAFGSQSGPDGRGAPIGSSEEGGGNVISVSAHRDASACKFTRSGSFGTNRSTAPTSPTTFRTNHDGGRFGTSALKNISLLQATEETKSVGGRFGVTKNETSSDNIDDLKNSFSTTTVGGAFGQRTVSTDFRSKASIGGSGSSLKPIGPLGEAFGVNLSISETLQSQQKEQGCRGSFDSESIKENQTAKVGGAFGSKLKTAFGGAFGAKQANQVSEFSTEREAKLTSGGAFGSSKATGSSMDGAFGGASSVLPDFSLSPPSFVKNSFSKEPMEENKTTIEQSFGQKVVGGGFGSKPAGTFAQLPSENVNAQTADGFSSTPSVGGSFGKTSFSEPQKMTGRGFGFKENEKPVTRATEVYSPRGGFGIGGLIENQSERGKSFESKEETQSPFMTAPPTMRGGFQGGFRGGRGSGGHIDFAAGQGHGMGRGRGQQTQPFVPQQRNNLPPFQTVAPDSKYKYTKPSEEVHEKMPIPADIALLNKFIQKEVKMMKDTVVDVQRQDPKSPLYSISSFRELRLKPEVLQALDTLNFQFPTRIQETALPLLLMEPPSNLIAQAQSGTGKTAAFVLTMLCRIDVNLKFPQCICLAPTLELAKQIGEVVEKMGKFMENLKIHYAIKGGNMAAMRGRKLTEQIVIGTPGITRDYLQKYKCIDPSTIRCLVLDEADVMIYHQGFTDISTTIYNMVEEASDSVQSMLFSATYDEPVINFATKIIKNAIVVMLKREEQALPNIKQFYVQCACRDSKYAAIVNLYSGLAVASSVIFCHTKASVMWLFENMKARGHQVDVLHGDMTVVERADTIIRFKRGDFKVLITTNVFARGIDVAQVSVVINYDLPIKYNEQDAPMVIDGYTQPDCETYLHRIGRTGRFGKTGIAINFIDSDDSMNMINILENHFQMKISRMDPSNLVELEAIEMS